MVDEPLTPLPIGLDHDFGVRCRVEAVTERPQLLTQLVMVVDAPVEDDHAFVVAHRLSAVVTDVDDGQPAVAEGDRSVVPEPLTIRSAQDQRASHGHGRRYVRGATIKTD